MASKDEGADKTEKPTPKRIRDARKEGDVSKSKDLTSTVLILGWLVGGWLMLTFMQARMKELFEQALRAIQLPFRQALMETAAVAFQTLLWLSVPLMAMAFFIGLVIEFLQVGPIVTGKKLVPKMDKLNPVEGVKKMFSLDNLVELIKSILKCAAMLGIGYYVLQLMMPSLLLLPYNSPASMGSMLWEVIKRIVIWTIVVFFFISALDVWYQKFSYMKKLRMSRRDIMQEVKENEGDPYVKSRRRQLHREWAQQNMLSAVRGSNVVVTNPTHIAVALKYEEGETDLPMVVAKGEGALAEDIKRAAEEAGIPIMQNVPLARGLNEKIELDEYISNEFFDAVAEILVWAETIGRTERSGSMDDGSGEPDPDHLVE